ncbi:hypothetical protein LCL96_02145 [Rossellomorea aquimaris]|uniref:hypothetical protein n=1 Tax=Rossellomorea aquimaris TaxID=189382 RepID=UPI001CD64C11|nr:hypothetical protein [Rossellomorea aquimaris]MCA1057713.1 hypothetical protein [Rossellomorea aquimaris]
MEDKLNELKRAMNSTTHEGRHFTELQKNKIRHTVHNPVETKRPSPFIIFSMTTVAICLIVFFVSTELLLKQNGSITGSPNTWRVHHDYKENNKALFSIIPDPELHAGKPYGYIFSFKESFDTFKGKDLSIKAVHKKTGQRIEVLSPQRITKPSPGYSSLQRFTANFQVPYSGIWRYEVYLDDKAYGNVVVSVAEKEEGGLVKLPEDIPDYVRESDFNQINWDRKATTFGPNMIGNENKSGIIGADMPSLSGQKWMWHLWDTEASDLTVVGYHRESGTVHPILNNGESWTIPLGGENNGADVHAPSSVMIPERGEWAFVLYTNGELFDVVVLEIDE